MRLLLIANVKAQTVTLRTIRFIERALTAQADVEMIRTERQGHAIELARRAVAEGYGAVAVLGGDGTINEVVNGLAGSRVPLGIIPGGGTNVLARSLGIPRDPVRAAGHLLALLRAEPRRIRVGRAVGRYFTFACGVGLDGEIVRGVERRQRLKKAGGHGYFVWSALRVGLLTYDLRAPRIRLRWGPAHEQARDGLSFAIAQNVRPYSYLLGRTLDVCPRADVRLGLDCFAAGNVGRLRVLKLALQAFGSGRHVRDRRAVYLHDQRRIEVTCSEPLPVQMDGEFIGHHDRLLLESVPDALRVLA